MNPGWSVVYGVVLVVRRGRHTSRCRRCPVPSTSTSTPITQTPVMCEIPISNDTAYCDDVVCSLKACSHRANCAQLAQTATSSSIQFSSRDMKVFRRPFVKRFALCYRTVVLSCLSCLSVCNVDVLWPNGWMNQDATWKLE